MMNNKTVFTLIILLTLGLGNHVYGHRLRHRPRTLPHQVSRRRRTTYPTNVQSTNTSSTISADATRKMTTMGQWATHKATTSGHATSTITRKRRTRPTIVHVQSTIRQASTPATGTTVRTPPLTNVHVQSTIYQRTAPATGATERTTPPTKVHIQSTIHLATTPGPGTIESRIHPTNVHVQSTIPQATTPATGTTERMKPPTKVHAQPTTNIAKTPAPGTTKRTTPPTKVHVQPTKHEATTSATPTTKRSTRSTTLKTTRRRKKTSAEFCLPKVTGKSNIRGKFDWPKTRIGNSINITCPYGPNDTYAQRKCEGNSSSGALWSIQDESECNFKSKRTQAFDELAKNKIDKSNAKEMARKTKDITRSAPANEINSEDVVLAANILENILNTGEVDSTGQDLVEIIDSVLNANNSVLAESQNTNRTASKYVEMIETIAANLTIPPGQTSRDLLSPNLFIQAVIPNMDTFTKKGYSVASKSPTSHTGNALTEGMVVSGELPAEQIQTGISLPPALATRLQQLSSSSVRFALSIYQNHKFFQNVNDLEEAINDTASHRWTVNTRVISCFAVGATMKNLKEPVVTTFEPLEQSTGYPVCAFWDFKANGGRGNWSSEGCKLATRSSGRLICHCNHMTNFAVIFSAQGPQSPATRDQHAQVLSVISYIGCALSLLGVLLTLITYAVFRSLRKSHAQHILMSLCVALALLLIVFMAGATRAGGMPGCRAVALLLHYFVLTVVLWMGVEGYQMYLAFVKVLATYQKNFMLKISVFAWGVPAVIVTTTAASAINSYGDEYHCVLRGIPFYAAMFAPTLAVVIGNFVIFFYVMWCLVRETRNAIPASNNSNIWTRCRTGIAVMVLLGLTWVFGALAIGDAKRVFEYLFCIFNTLQGLFIFVFYCARQPEVRKQWKSLCSRQVDPGMTTKFTSASNTPGHRLRSDTDNSQTKLSTERYVNPAYSPESMSGC